MPASPTRARPPTASPRLPMRSSRQPSRADCARSSNHHAQSLAGSAERALNLLVVLAFGEHEAQVPVAFRERMDGLADGDGDGQADDSGHGPGFGAAVNRPQHAGPVDGKQTAAGGP